MFIRFDRIHERDRQTNGQTPHDGIGRACIASRGKTSWALKRIITFTQQMRQNWLSNYIELNTAAVFDVPQHALSWTCPSCGLFYFCTGMDLLVDQRFFYDDALYKSTLSIYLSIYYLVCWRVHVGTEMDLPARTVSGLRRRSGVGMEQKAGERDCENIM